ncbi:MAG: hypothetical protein NTY03_18385 [Candidatus Bathyarchaeota archaeon]|nr:hypothetical protein [Candidatus Bathyarchaeota archaeon]
MDARENKNSKVDDAEIDLKMKSLEASVVKLIRAELSPKVSPRSSPQRTQRTYGR